jgi:hypothetical protein
MIPTDLKSTSAAKKGVLVLDCDFSVCGRRAARLVSEMWDTIRNFFDCKQRDSPFISKTLSLLL